MGRAMKFPPWILAGLLIGLALPAMANVVEVSQKGRKFQPDTVDLMVGDTLKIHNDDEFLHHVYVKSPDYNFDSEEQPPGKDVTLPPFTHVGEYNVLCGIHPKMKLVVHVK